mgnify:CR=1 FL=1|jgi:hypothetical protein
MAHSKRSWVVIILLILLGLRIAVGGISVAGNLLEGEIFYGLFLLVMLLLHIGAFLWILRADKRGPMVVFLIVIVDILLTIFMLAGVGLIQILVFDGILALLAYRIWKDAGGKNLMKDAQKMVGR